ncbi:MAG: hypothetical protein IPJ78_13475 [Gemmatimonadetes bacterium]|nr:hypothetical protein [Gemmatimonadota bacterium]
MTHTRYLLVATNSSNANAAGLAAGDVIAVPIGGGEAVTLRHAGSAPPLGLRARLESEGALIPLATIRGGRSGVGGR